MGSGSFGGSKSSSKTTPVTWQRLMTPYQIHSMASTYGPLTDQALMAFKGQGLSPTEQTRQKSLLTSGLAEYAGGMRQNVANRAADTGQKGGVVEGAHQNIDAAKIMGMSSGLRSIEDMNQAEIQRKIDNLMKYMLWTPPYSSESKGSGFGFNTSGGYGVVGGK